MSLTVNYFFKKALFFLLILFGLFSFSLGERVIRVSGDDKVYVSQAVEMAQNETWFFQSMHEKPDYLKGPLLVILIRAGMLIFDHSMWATTYMNFIFLFFALLSLSRLPQDKNEIPFLFLTFLTIFLFTYTSQMESLLASLYAISLYFIYQSSHRKKFSDELTLWFIAGVCGWLKSPLHSLLLGLSIILYWKFKGVLLQKILSIKSWCAWAFGIFTCLSLYLPIFIYDYETFYHTYIGRETLWKAWNGSYWYEPIIPLFTYFIFPWPFVFWAAFISFILSLKKSIKNNNWKIFNNSSERDLFLLAVALILPSLLFFSYFQYRVNTYLIPVTSGMALLFYTCVKNTPHIRIISLSLGMTGFILFISGCALTSLIFYMSPWPEWFSMIRAGICVLGVFIIALSFIWNGVFKKTIFSQSLFISVFCFYFGLSQIMVTFGEREMDDIKSFIKEKNLDPNLQPFIFFNKNQGIWSEWGYLNFWANYPIKAVYTWEALTKAFHENKPLIITNEEELNHFKSLMSAQFIPYELTSWKRWRTHGKTPEGQPRWIEAIRNKDLSLLEKEYFLVHTPSIK